MNIWIASTFWLLWIAPLSAFIYVFSVLFHVHLGVELLGHRLHYFLRFLFSLQEYGAKWQYSPCCHAPRYKALSRGFSVMVWCESMFPAGMWWRTQPPVKRKKKVMWQRKPGQSQRALGGSSHCLQLWAQLFPWTYGPIHSPFSTALSRNTKTWVRWPSEYVQRADKIF